MNTYMKTAGRRASVKPHLTILTFLALLWVCPFVFAQSQPETGLTQDNSQGLPPGYTSLVLNMEGIRERMTQEQIQGKGGHWPGWMRPGLEEGNSIYWWLLAQWHHNEGNRDQAYRTLLTAWALSRMEGTTCLGIDDRLLDRILLDHRDILEAGATTNEAKREAILTALKTAEKMIENKPLRGMICNINPARRAVENQKASRERWQVAVEAAIRAGRQPPKPDQVAPLTLIDNQVTRNSRDQESIRVRQERELDKVAKEYNATQARKASDITSIMNLMNQF